MSTSDLDRRFPLLFMARRNITRTKVRSGLASLGIIIGVVAIASLGMFGTTLQQGATESIGSIGNQVIVTPATGPNAISQDPYLDEREARAISQEVQGARAVVPVEQEQAQVSHGSEERTTIVYGIENPEQLFTARSGSLGGTVRSGAAVGAGLADRLDLRVRDSIRVNGEVYRVQAILRQSDGFAPIDPSSAVVLPPGSLDTPGYGQVVVLAEGTQTANASAQAIRQGLNERGKRVTVTEFGSVIGQISSFFDLLNAFLIGVGSISLLVAGVSIFNVMLMSTVEREEEIGVLRAVGFQRGDILRMLLTEAIVLGVLGGLIGSVLSVGAGMILNSQVANDPFAVFVPQNALYVALAFGFAVLTSVLSGLYPAWKAARKQPAAALRG